MRTVFRGGSKFRGGRGTAPFEDYLRRLQSLAVSRCGEISFINREPAPAAALTPGGGAVLAAGLSS